MVTSAERPGVPCRTVPTRRTAAVLRGVGRGVPTVVLAIDRGAPRATPDTQGGPMRHAALAILAYLGTVVIAVAASLAHPPSDGERHFVKAVAELGTAAASALNWR